MARLIERSPLPFGRHRWVLDRGPAEIDFAPCARPRAELSDWADERSQLPVDPESGPGWHLGVVSLTDGSTAISLVASHYLLDGIGFMIAIIEAIQANTYDFGYPPPRSRTRLRAAVEDARQAARDAPEVARALVAAASLFRRQRRAGGQPPAPAPVAVGPEGDDGDTGLVVPPGITISIDMDDWDARAESLGASSNTLAAALTAKLAEHLGRRRDGDGAVTVQLLISDRTEGDTRAIAVSLARVSVDPAQVTTDLRDARAAIKQALTDLRESPDEALGLAALAPLTPKRTWRRGVEAGFADPARPVVCSNLGDVGSVISLVDGTHCDYAFARGIRQRVARQWLDRSGGQLQLLSLRTPVLRKLFIHVVAYQPGADNTKPALRRLAARALEEFGLTGAID
ncbi:hypothetical protein [Mycobacterium sp. 050134]|uniref:hypothetical protein n=1 Tax=Mycobacterium sp. 050134 TaxID=3096111 RepID=UPI002ED94153